VHTLGLLEQDGVICDGDLSHDLHPATGKVFGAGDE